MFCDYKCKQNHIIDSIGNFFWFKAKMSVASQELHYVNRFLSDAIMRTLYGERDRSADVPMVANCRFLNYVLHVFSI